MSSLGWGLLEGRGFLQDEEVIPEPSFWRVRPQQDGGRVQARKTRTWPRWRPDHRLVAFRTLKNNFFFFFVKPSSLWHFVTATHGPTWQRGSTNNSHSPLPCFLGINLARNIQNLAKRFKMPPMIWEGLNGNTIFCLGYIQHVDLSKLCESNDKFRLILVKSQWNFFWVFDKMILKYAWKKNKTCYRKKEQWHLQNIKTHCTGRIIQIILYS